VTPQKEEAIEIFADVVRSLSSNDRDLMLVLRRCQHACELVGWGEQRDWFRRELAGYPSGTAIPSYRQVQGRLKWIAKGSTYVQINREMERNIFGLEPDDAEEEDTTLEVVAGIEFILTASNNGYREGTEETKEEWSRRRNQHIDLERVKVFQPLSFAGMAGKIENMTFEFASESYTFLQYGNVLTDFWADYRSRVDAALRQLNLTAHLDVIQAGLQSDNQEAWRSAMLECRNLLNDVANHLWQDPRATYEHIGFTVFRAKPNLYHRNTGVCAQ